MELRPQLKRIPQAHRPACGGGAIGQSCLSWPVCSLADHCFSWYTPCRAQEMSMGLIRCSGGCLEGQLSFLQMLQPHRVHLPSWVEARCLDSKLSHPPVAWSAHFVSASREGRKFHCGLLWRKIRPPSLAKAVGTLHSSV